MSFREVPLPRLENRDPALRRDLDRAPPLRRSMTLVDGGVAAVDVGDQLAQRAGERIARGVANSTAGVFRRAIEEAAVRCAEDQRIDHRLRVADAAECRFLIE